MRASLLFLFACCAVLPGCSKRQNFDADYKATDAKLQAEIKRLDGEIDGALKREPGEGMQKNAEN